MTRNGYTKPRKLLIQNYPFPLNYLFFWSNEGNWLLQGMSTQSIQVKSWQYESWGDSSDYRSSINTIRYHMRIMFCILDRVVFSCYLIICALLVQNIWDAKWKRYRNKDQGRRRVQVYLNIIIYTINRPHSVRECKLCWWCFVGVTR